MKSKKIFVYLAFIFLLYAMGCINDADSSSADGYYNYLAYDSLGTIVSKGWIIIAVKDSSKITGKWEINKVGNPLNIGPQVGKGDLEGSYINDRLVLGLNPNFVDNNIILEGKTENHRYSGKWYYSSFIGLTNWGKFEAVKE